MEVVMQAKGWEIGDFSLAEQLTASEQSLALCHDRIQAMVYTVGHPNPSVSKAVGLCNALLVEVSGPEIDRLVKDNPYYAYTTIPGGVYHNNPDPVITFGVKATVVTSANVDADVVYTVVKSLFDGLDEFRQMHPAWGGLSAQTMVVDGLSAPLHDGALRYYSEVGLK
jgi:TRAP transporter TAXI family solute receptor